MPSRAFAAGWSSYVEEWWRSSLTAYRERVHDVYESAADARCDHFVLWNPVELLIVGSLAGEWVFARPSTSDVTTLVERWGDPLLARYSAISRADSAAYVQQVLRMDHGYVLVQRHELNQVHFELVRPDRVPPTDLVPSSPTPMPTPPPSRWQSSVLSPP